MVVMFCGTLSIMQVNNDLYKINFVVYAYVTGQWPTKWSSQIGLWAVSLAATCLLQ